MFSQKRSVDLILFVTVFLLLAVGVVMVYSASSVEAQIQYGDSFYFAERQFIWAAIGLAVMIVTQNISYPFWLRIYRPVITIGVLLLGVLLIPGVGETIAGSRRWISIGPLNLQPSEPIKLAMVVYLAAVISKSGEETLKDFRHGLLPHLLVAGFVSALIMAQPDLGTTVAILGTTAVLLFIGGARVTHLLGLGAVGITGVLYLILGIGYQKHRFMAFLDPWEEPLGAGFQIIQSLYALGSGGLLGLGLGQSRQKLFYLPEQHTDFIFSIIGEELGFLGGSLIIGLFVVFAWRGYRIAITAPDTASSLLAAGITTMIVLQTFINLSVVTNSLPATGIPLPLVSYGGSSLVFTLAGIGILLNVSRHAEG